MRIEKFKNRASEPSKVKQAEKKKLTSKGVMSEGGEKPGEVLQIKIKKVLLGNRNDLCQLLLMGQE